MNPDDCFTDLPRSMRARIRREEHWLWVGPLHLEDGTSTNGGVRAYGLWTERGQRPRRSHRVVYELLIGPIPDGLVLDHLCGEPLCCRPSHLEPVTIIENGRRQRQQHMPTAARQETCLPVDGIQLELSWHDEDVS